MIDRTYLWLPTPQPDREAMKPTNRPTVPTILTGLLMLAFLALAIWS
jgi:hypothetical protein